MRRGIAILIVSSMISTISVSLGHAAPPDLECYADEQARIDPITLDAEHSDVSDVYRIKDGSLLITTPGGTEYVYNEVVETESGRFVSGHKTMLLSARTADLGRKLLVLHFHESDIRITRFFCR
jgi:hypothetical protein